MDFNSSSLSTVSPVNSVFYSRNFLASVSKYLGRHSLTFGFDYRGIHTDFTNLNYSAGDFKFNGAFTEQFPNVAGSGSDFADALLGYPYQGEVDTTTKLFLHVNYFSGYIQDDFRVNSKLTLNLGLRYEYETGISEDNNHLVVGFNGLALNPLAANVTGITPRGAVEYAGVNGNSTSCCNPSAKKFGPRIGVAYSLNDKTVIRGGFGIFYAPTRFADDPGMALGYTQATTYVASNNGNATPANSLSNPFPGGVLQPQGNARGALAGVGSSFNFLDQGRGSGEVLQYSVDVQRQLPSNIALEVGYIGSSSRHLQDSSTGTGAYNINQVPDSALALGSQLSSPVANPYFQNGGTGVIGSSTVTNAQLLKPYSPFSTIGILTNPSYALYNSMIVKAQKRLSAGLTFLSAFTWSKNMDNEFAGTNFFSGSSTAPQDAYNLAAEYSLAVADTPLRWSNTVSYYLPFGKGKMFLNKSKLVDYAVGGWQVNFTNIYQSGFPLAISQSSNQNSILGTAVQRPNATGVSPSMSGSVEQRLNGYINSAAFSSAPIYTFGN
ncbi:MAG TPA: carboxypeptidase regulatory-like domain-containing protein, partial [Verrucomicrobiae bacterium]|nr:carboxypeptidase regulatory-like domain-containing protein [Verrucomicrobiae bacterium]